MTRQPWWYQLCVESTRSFLNSLWDFRTVGDLNVPLTGGVIVACTHQSHLDPWFLQACLTRRVRYVARSTLFRNPLFGGMLRGLGAIPFDREATTATAMKDLAARVKEGRALAMFPEGTRSKDGEIGRLRPGIALLIRRSKAPVVPAAVDGAFDCWPRQKKFFRPGRVRIVIGEPMTFARTEGREEVLGRLGERLVSLRDEARALA
ncbi:MAG: lysophospholipid acyltransferase family protein [Planctomycetota bacterium]